MDIKDEIGKVLKQMGFDFSADTEEMAVKAVKLAFELVRVLVPKYSKGLGEIIGPMTYLIEPKVLKALDSIDGHDNPAY